MKRQRDMKLEYEPPRLVGIQYTTRDQWINNSRKNEGMKPKKKQHLGVNGTGDGTWKVRSMNQSKLEEIKQEMARVNIDI